MHLSLYDPEYVAELLQKEVERFTAAAMRHRKERPYVSAFLPNYNSILTEVVDGEVGEEERKSQDKVLITVHYPGRWTEYAIAKVPAPRQLHLALTKAERLAFGAHKNGKTHKLLHPDPAKLSYRSELDLKSFEDLTFPSLSTRLKEIEEVMAKTDGIISSKAKLEVLVGHEIYVDSLKRRTIQDIGRMYVYLRAFAKADDMPDGYFELGENVGCFGAVKELDELLKKSLVVAPSLAKRAVMFAGANQKIGRFDLLPGSYDVVMDGAMAEYAIHELGTGHLVEADRFLIEGKTGNPFRGKLGKRIAIPDLTIIDNPRLVCDGVKPPSYFEVDHEGVLGGPTFLVKDGKFKSYLTSRRSAGSLGEDLINPVLTGNARVGAIEVEEKDDEGEAILTPVPPESRMSTMYLVPNKKSCSLQDLLKKVAGKGLYLAMHRSKGEVTFKRGHGEVVVKEMYFVKENLELVPLRVLGEEAYIAGNVSSYMRNIAAVGDKTTVTWEAGWCESDSGEIPQCGGGAAILARNVTIGFTKLEENYTKPFVKVPSRK